LVGVFLIGSEHINQQGSLRVSLDGKEIEKMTPPQTWLLRWGMKLKRHHLYLIEGYHPFSSRKGQQILD
jgi:hypothetical protein